MIQRDTLELIRLKGVHLTRDCARWIQSEIIVLNCIKGLGDL